MLVTQSCPILCNPKDYSLPGSSVHGILQARILEWDSISFSRESSWNRDWSQVSSLQSDSLPSEPPEKPDLFAGTVTQDKETVTQELSLASWVPCCGIKALGPGSPCDLETQPPCTSMPHSEWEWKWFLKSLHLSSKILTTLIFKIFLCIRFWVC